MIIQPPVPRERNLFLHQRVDQGSVNSLVRSIVEINEHDQYIKKIQEVNDSIYNPKPIKIYIDCFGGVLYQCLGLLGVMEKSDTPVETIVAGCAMSCGFLISITARKRYCYPTSTFLYHQLSNTRQGMLKDMEEGLVEDRRLQKIAEKHTLKYTNLKKKDLQEAYESKKDWYIDAQDALQYGIVDEII